MVPSARFIWLVVIVGFPAAVAAGLAPGARPAALIAMTVVIAAAAVDALMRGRALAGIRIELPELLRFFKDRDGQIRVRIHNQSRQARRLRVGIVAPEGFDGPVQPLPDGRGSETHMSRDRQGAVVRVIPNTGEEQTVDLPASADAAEFTWTWTPRRRGRYPIRACYLEAQSPLGLWTIRRPQPVALEIRVYPNLRRDDDLKALRRGSEGFHALRQVGRGREFEKLREYVPGDGFDEIHWKATARRGHPITKVFQVERTQEVYVVIDASRLSARAAGSETVLERSISAALIGGAAAERRGDLFGLAAFAQQVEAFTRARSGKAHYAACRDAIYELQPRPVSPDFDEIAAFLRLRLRRRALLLFLTSLDDPVIAENFTRAMRLLARRHLVIAGMARPADAQPLFQNPRVESADDVYRQLAGHLAWKHLRELESTLARQGVRMAMLDPDRLGSGLIGLYDEVKQRQLL